MEKPPCVDDDDVELRCRQCIELQVECPRGYYGGPVSCDVCGYTMALCEPLCAPTIDCLKCGGSVTYSDLE